MPDQFSRRILDHLTDRRYEPSQIRELSSELGIPEDQFEQFSRSVEQLIEQGQVVLGASNALVLPPLGPELVGVFRLNARGFGFVVPDRAAEHGDLFVPAGNTEGAMTGDLVRARVVHRDAGGIRGSGGRREGGRSPYIGRIIQIIRRAEKKYVGSLQQRGSSWVVLVDAKLLHDPVLIRDVKAKDAKAGDKVVIELVKYPTEKEPPEGVITEVLGEGGQPDVETVAVMRAYGIADPFPEDVVEEARTVARSFDDDMVPKDREDLTEELVITIDPPDARDFDDAISIRRLNSGSDGAAFELGVHIADVSNFVKPDSLLDQEARARGNSTYLPRKVLPMLPELLSNGVCSLQAGVVRLCKSAFMSYDADGTIVSRRFSRSVIRSDKRLTYREAQALIDGDMRAAVQHAQTDTTYSPGLVEMLQLMDELAKLIRQRRLAAGMIELDLPEVELVFDDSGRVMDAIPEDDAFTHKIIEMFMVEANESSAVLFDALDLPMVRRTHPEPVSHDVKQLRQFARVAGYNIPSRPTRQELQGLLDAVRGKPAQKAVHLAVLRTLSRAEYSPLLIGHFALASEHYTHFTSPIRRYPDLVVHHGLDLYLDAHECHRRQFLPSGRDRKAVSRAIGDGLPNESAMVELGKHCSATERNSEAAERDLRNYLVLELLGDQQGEDFDGTVTGVTGSGIYVQIDRYLVDGFVRLSDLPGSGTGRGERWQVNRATGALVAQRSGKTVTIGDRFVVRVASVDPPARVLELVILEGRTSKQKQRRQNPGAREANQRAQKLKQLKKKDQRQTRRKAH